MQFLWRPIADLFSPLTEGTHSMNESYHDFWQNYNLFFVSFSHSYNCCLSFLLFFLLFFLLIFSAEICHLFSAEFPAFRGLLVAATMYAPSLGHALSHRT